MGRFRYIFSHGKCELAFSDSSGRDAELIFPRGVSGEVRIGTHTVPLVSGRGSLRITTLADGIYVPVLIRGEEETALPPLKKEGNRVTNPGYTPDELCEKFDELRRTRSALRELTEKCKQLEEYILGKGIF